MLVDEVTFVCNRDDLALVDVVNGEMLQDLSFHEMTDARACHHGDGDRAFHFFDEGRIRHALHAGGGRGSGRIRDEDGACAGGFGDLGLVYGGDLDDGAAAEDLS